MLHAGRAEMLYMTRAAPGGCEPAFDLLLDSQKGPPCRGRAKIRRFSPAHRRR